MSDIAFSSVLDDLSNNIYNLSHSYPVNDISNQILNLNQNIDELNNKVVQVLNIYNTIAHLKERFNN